MAVGQPANEPGSKSPLDDPQGRAPGDRERTPELPDGAPEKMPQESEGGVQPDSPFGSEERGDNAPGLMPASKPPGDPAQPRGEDRWGDLPPRAREVFRTKGGADLPVQYRDWIDAYYRRLNR